MHKTTDFSTEVNSQVLNLQRINFQPLKMCTRFNLTFQKQFSSFPNQNHHKTDRKCWPPCLGDKEILSF